MHTSAGINLGYSLRPVTDGMLQIQILTFPSQHAFKQFSAVFGFPICTPLLHHLPCSQNDHLQLEVEGFFNLEVVSNWLFHRQNEFA